MLVILFNHLELTDIWLAEDDLQLGWSILRAWAFLTLVFHLTAFVNLSWIHRFFDDEKSQG